MLLPRRLAVYLIGFELLAITVTASAEILVEERFLHVNGNLVGQAPSPGPGSAWAALEDEGNTAIQVSNEMAVLRQGSGSGGREDALIGFPRQGSAATTYARFDFALPRNGNLDIVNLDAMGNNFVLFKSNLLTTHFRARTGVLAPSGDGDFRLAINANGSRLDEGTAWPTALSFDTMYRVVVNWNAATGESKLWLNPDSELSSSISNVGHSTGQRLEGFVLRQSSDYSGIQYVDNLVVATTFAEALLGSETSSGDYNHNSVVDAADFVTWRKGTATQTEYNLWRANFGRAFGGSSVTTFEFSGAFLYVPEPASIFLVMIGSVACGFVRSQRRMQLSSCHMAFCLLLLCVVASVRAQSPSQLDRQKTNRGLLTNPSAIPGLKDPAKKEIAMQLVSSAENSTLDWKAQYGYIEYNVEGNETENRGYTAGIIGFTSKTHDMFELVEYYDKIAPGNTLSKYLPALRRADGSSSQQGLGKIFEHDWKSAGKDSKFREAQDHERDRVYFNPAVDQAQHDGLRTLGQFIYYDAIVMHGPGDDPTSFGGIRSTAMKKAMPPVKGGDEAVFLNAFLDARKAVMLTEQGHTDTTRVDTMQRTFLQEDNLNLNPPLRFKVYGDRFIIRPIGHKQPSRQQD